MMLEMIARNRAKLCRAIVCAFAVGCLAVGPVASPTAADEAQSPNKKPDRIRKERQKRNAAQNKRRNQNRGQIKNQLEFFETKIRPVLVEHCYECHSEKSDEIAGGLVLDTREGIRRRGSR